MATKTQPPPYTFPRVRLGFGKHSRSQPSQPEPPEHENDEDWYIPYNGPYELPPSSTPLKTFDSSGRLLASVLGNVGSGKSSDMGREWPGGRMESGQNMMSAFSGSGVHSTHPYRIIATTDTAGVTPSPTTTSFTGRSPISQTSRGARPTIVATSSTAFANIDTTGGVGESPTPVQRTSPLHASPPASSRLNFANFLSFGGSVRKSRSDSATSPRHSSRKQRSRNHSLTLDPLQSNHATATMPDERHPPRPHSHVSLSLAMERGPRQRSHTLIGTSRAAVQTPSPSQDSYAASFYSRESPLSSHPYAYSASRTESPRRAPIVISPLAPRSLDKGKGVDRSHQYPQPPVRDTQSNTGQVPVHLRPASRTSLFKTISAPNLRNFSRDFSIGKHFPSRGKYRWLSPETWCDALLFPRPRFLEYIDDDPPQLLNHHQPSHVRPSEAATTIRKPYRPFQMALRGSQSAVNLLAPNSASSSGPPRAEPMLMVRRGSIDGVGQSSPARPLSFAQDDIALPTSALSLTRVLEMRTSFEHERAAWKVQAASSLQSSKRTRSLGRSRSQSVGRARAQLKDMGGMGFLATKTLLGNQIAAPTVHARTPSDSTQTRSGTSHARTNSSGGVSRPGSRSRAALRAATGLCVSDDKMGPQEERNDTFFSIDSRGKGVRSDAIVPSADVGPSPSPQVTNNSDVGLAFSSPLSPADAGSAKVPTRPLRAQDQPYVQDGGGTASKRSQHGRSGSDYAGPHPSAVSITAPPAAHTSDMSARHRLPPHAALHPYASGSTYPNATSSQHAAVFYPKGLHQVPPDDLPPSQELPKSRPQLLDARETGRVGPHAYASASASGNRLSGEPLAFADALSYGLRRPGSADSGLGESENHFGSSVATTSLYTPIPNLVLTTMSEHPQDSAPAAPDSAFLLSSHTSQTYTVASSSLPELPNPPALTTSVLSYSFHSQSAQASLFDESLAAGSGSSSPQRSPRPFSSIEDLDRYRNLFYRPRGSGSSRTPSGEHRRVLPRETTSQDASSNNVISSSAGSGLSTLTRQLSNELEGSGGDLLNGSPHMWGLRYGGLMGSDGAGSRTDPNAVLSVTSDSEMNSNFGAGATGLPFSLHQSFGIQGDGSSLIVPIPQDVDSRRNSSVLDRSETEEVHHDELLRMGTVEAISTPSATVPPMYRLSFMGDVHGSISQESLSRPRSRSRSRSRLHVDATANNDSSSSLLESRQLLLASSTSLPARSRSSRGSLLPAGLPSATTEVTRSSYQTDGTGASRISGLSDFPVPPSQTVVPSDRVGILKSYFDDGSGSDGSGNVHSRPASSQIDRPSRTSGAGRSQRSSLAGSRPLPESWAARQ